VSAGTNVAHPFTDICDMGLEAAANVSRSSAAHDAPTASTFSIDIDASTPVSVPGTGWPEHRRPAAAQRPLKLLELIVRHVPVCGPRRLAEVSPPYDISGHDSTRWLPG